MVPYDDDFEQKGGERERITSSLKSVFVQKDSLDIIMSQ